MKTDLNPFGEPQRDLRVDLDKFAAALEEQRQRAIQAEVEKRLAGTIAMSRLEFLAWLIRATEPTIFCRYADGSSAQLAFWPPEHARDKKLDWMPVADAPDAAVRILGWIDEWNSKSHVADLPPGALPDTKIDLRDLRVTPWHKHMMICCAANAHVTIIAVLASPQAEIVRGGAEPKGA